MKDEQNCLDCDPYRSTGYYDGPCDRHAKVDQETEYDRVMKTDLQKLLNGDTIFRSQIEKLINERSEIISSSSRALRKRITELERQLGTAQEEAVHWKAQCARGFNVAKLIQERNEAMSECDTLNGVILACHRAFIGGSDFVQSEARRLTTEVVEKYSNNNKK